MEFSLSESWAAITDWIRTYMGTPAWLLLIAGIAAVYLFIVNRDVRVRILIPLLVLAPIVINPWLYHYIYRDLRYWRFFWLIPQSVLIALAFNDLCRRFAKAWLKCLALLALSGIIVLAGYNLFQWEDWFTPAENPYKIRSRVIEICDMILEDEPQPLCLFDNIVSFETRQYSSAVRQCWTKRGMGSDPEGQQIFDMMQEPERDWARVFEYAEKKGCTHVTVRPKKNEKIKAIRKIAKKYGYTVLGKVEKHTVFRRADS